MSEETHSKSRSLYAEAIKVLPGGVSRNMICRKPHPDYATAGTGCHVTDIDGTVRIDFANNTASLIHGHAHPAIVSAVTEQLQRGTAFSMATESELRFAQHLCSRNQSFEKIRFMNSGTEAVMAMIKAARAITGRPKIAKSEGAYHGTYDYAEVSQKSKPENWGLADSPASVPLARGTPQRALEDVVIVPFNNVDQTIDLLNQHKDELACVMIDPLPHRAGLVPATPEFMEAIRAWTTENGALFALDEVISFRMGYGGACDWYPNVQPDLTSLGKIIGGGFPVGALAGKDEFMACLDPTKDRLPFPFSGTFSANPITMTGGLVAMERFDRAAVEQLNLLGNYARKEIEAAIHSTGTEACVTGAGSMFRVYLKSKTPTEYRSAWQDADEVQKINFLVDHLYHHGFMMIGTCSAALSTVLGKDEVDQLVESLAAGFQKLKSQT
ncbi:aspartate aminotransferase family protein [Mariniblastus fucicola]|uniref:Glutamate-1-semialdehyde 2,1-aminomutase 1 n=1 Tax=Mariniblastus fucicola TaxID=980251 RepID=A0A5B9PE00_9BACT|nr:aspartate aminotransferase family protein [Mariniblastus fucicola]QEG23719.1 Glutamate-1-semialdehyde 2,1-aminomutase 1 [Mariniblastus fucicola]